MYNLLRQFEPVIIICSSRGAKQPRNPLSYHSLDFYRNSFTWGEEEGAGAPWERAEEAEDAWISVLLPCSGLTREAWEATAGSLGSWEEEKGDLPGVSAGLVRDLNRIVRLSH